VGTIRPIAVTAALANLVLGGCMSNAESDAAERRISTWMVVMKTNVDIHISAIGRYEDDLVKRDGQWLILRRLRSE
jgi:hypothetical protein